MYSMHVEGINYAALKVIIVIDLCLTYNGSASCIVESYCL